MELDRVKKKKEGGGGGLKQSKFADVNFSFFREINRLLSHSWPVSCTLFQCTD